MTSNTGEFTEFVHQHSRALFGTALLLTGTSDRAEELLQDTLADLYPKWQRVMMADSSLAYVRRSMTNRYISQQRRPSAKDIAIWDLPDRPAPGDIAETIAGRHQVWQLLETVSGRQRAALVLRYFHDLPDDEIAASLGCRVGTVRSLISRGLESLREKSEAGTRIQGGAA